MKAELSADGTLTITPQTATEAFALRCWQDAQTRRKERPALVVKTELEPAVWCGTGTAITGWPAGTTISTTDGMCP